MELRGIVMTLLIMLPGYILGFIGGVLVMRKNYVPLIRWYQRQNQRLQRRADAPVPWME